MGASKAGGENRKLDRETGFNTRVNLFIIRYLYSHVKKADGFMYPNINGGKSSIDLKDIIGFTKQRLLRIFNGDNYYMTAEESGHIAEKFNISRDFFKKDSDLIPIHGIGREDWKCYFYKKYKGSVAGLKLTDDIIEKKQNKVAETLEKIVKDSYIKKHYDKDSELYHIYYYYTEYATYKPDTPLVQFLKSLEALKVSDWKELTDNPEELKKYHQHLQKHFEYVSAYLKIYELQKNI